MESLNTQVVTETLHRLFCWIESQGKATPSSTFWGTTRKITDHKGQNNKLGKLWPPWKHTLSQLKESFSLTPCCCKVLKQQPCSMLLEWAAKKTTGEWHHQNGKIGVFCGLPSPKNTNFDHHPWIECPCGSPRATEKVPACHWSKHEIQEWTHWRSKEQCHFPCITPSPRWHSSVPE